MTTHRITISPMSSGCLVACICGFEKWTVHQHIARKTAAAHTREANRGT